MFINLVFFYIDSHSQRALLLLEPFDATVTGGLEYLRELLLTDKKVTMMEWK